LRKAKREVHSLHLQKTYGVAPSGAAVAKGVRMYRSAVLNAVFAALVPLAVCSGCEETTGDLVSLNGIVSNPVAVEVGLVNGHIALDFSSAPLDAAQETEMRRLLTLGVVELTLTNNATGVSVNLTDGVAVTVEPEQPGEYQAVVSADGTEVSVIFTNSFDGASVHAGGDYTASVSVGDNDFFETEEFVRQVVVTQ
jgi:hypothetical protein